MNPVTGRMPAMLQDCSRALSKWLANRIDSRRHAREAAAAIKEPASCQGPDFISEMDREIATLNFHPRRVCSALPVETGCWDWVADVLETAKAWARDLAFLALLLIGAAGAGTAVGALLFIASGAGR